MTIPLQSGYEWEDDPRGNANSHDGRTIRRDMRAKSDSTLLVIVKRPQPQVATTEIYSIGMERVAYTLASELGLPVPDTWLEEVDGHRSSVQRRIPEGRSWIQIGGAPGMRDNVQNENIYPLAAAFDVWMGNTDRRNVNLLFEPLPPGTTPGRARGSCLWLIDHGQCGLWPADKFDLGRNAENIPTTPGEVAGGLVPEAEQVIAGVMPPEYRMALKNTQGEDRAQLLDRITGINDDAIDAALAEIPEAYISAGRAAATCAALKVRRDALDTVLSKHW